MCLKHAAQKPDIKIIQMSINDKISQIVNTIFCGEPDAVGFSCYIWNIEHVLKTASCIKKILPECFIIFGGPEVSFNSADMMKKHSFIDMIIKGRGEAAFSYFLQRFESGSPIDSTPSACIRTKEKIISNEPKEVFDMNSLPFLYGGLDYFKNKIIYYETSRGCPYSCDYCMSAGEDVSHLSLQRVKEELEFFIKSNVRQVKLVDRTFNYPPERANKIFKMLLSLSEKYPESSTSFHFEISANIIEDETIKLIRSAKKGFFKFEIGVQSTHPPTLKAVNRNHDMKKLLGNTRTLCAMENIHVHADLIAGLPLEGYREFSKSFNDVYSLGADKIQLGFLKVLKGSRMRETAQKYGIEYTDYAPYEVLSTHALSYEEIQKLHRIEHLTDALYNTKHFVKTLEAFVPLFCSPFDFYNRFAEFLCQKEYFASPKKKQFLFDMLILFAKISRCKDVDVIKEALIFDWLCMEKPRSWPKQIEISQTDEQKLQIRAFFKNKECIQKYLPGYQKLSGGEISKRCFIYQFESIMQSAVLFDYGKNKDADNFCRKINFDFICEISDNKSMGR